MFHWSPVKCGRLMPTWAYAHRTRPEQSKALGPAAPQTYGSPRLVSAARRACAPIVLAVGISMLGKLPVFLNTVMALANTALFRMLIFFCAACRLTAIWAAKRATTLLCCAAVALARCAAATAAAICPLRAPFLC